MRLFTASTILLSLLAIGCTQEISRDQLAAKVGRPCDVQFFGDHAMYMGDADGYRYVHVHDLFSCLTFLGEREYKIPESQWPMQHPMPLTDNANFWQDVQWMNGDAPPGIPQSVFLTMTPTFPLGAPKTQPSEVPPTRNFETRPAR